MKRRVCFLSFFSLSGLQLHVGGGLPLVGAAEAFTPRGGCSFQTGESGFYWVFWFVILFKMAPTMSELSAFLFEGWSVKIKLL